MKSENSEHKGKVIMEEKKIPGKTIVILVLLGYLVYGAFMFWLFCPGSCILFITVMLMPILLLAHLLERKSPLIVYEHGFDAPLETYRILKGDKRFVPFSNIKKIQPYLNLISPPSIRGYVVITADGMEIKLLDPATEGRIYMEGLKKGLGKRWERLYSPEPYGLLDGFNEEKMRRCLSKNGRWIAAFTSIGLLLIIPALLLIPFIDKYFLLFMIFLSGAYIGGPFGILLLMERKACVRRYELIARFRPDIARRVKPEKDEVTSADMVRKFDRKDWMGLQRALSVNPVWLFAVSILLLVVGTAISGYKGVRSIGFYLIFFGMGLSAIAALLIFFVMGKTALLRSIIEEEHRIGERIIPDYFVIPKWMEIWWLPYRDAPKLTEEEWKKIADKSVPLGEKDIALVMTLFISLFFLGFISMILFSRMGLPGFVVLTLFFALTFLPLIFFMRTVKYKVISRKILTYEEETGEKVIPEKYRKRIESAFLHAYRK